MRLKVTVGMYDDKAQMVDGHGKPIEATPIKMVGFIMHIQDEDVITLSRATQKAPELIADMVVLRVKEAAQGVVTGFFKGKKLAALAARATDAMRSMGRLASVHQSNQASDRDLDQIAGQVEADVKAFRKVLKDEDVDLNLKGPIMEREIKGGLIH
jgi:hypothetical protein